jgi:hypothetical protein
MTERVRLYTSLPPAVTRTIAGAEVGASYVAECVRSWRRAGFDVVSLNGAHELDDLVRKGYEAECRQIPGERPAIDDVLAAVRASQASVAGIINADVLLMADPGLLRMAASGTDGMTLIERINIDADSLRPTGQSCSGFDAFIFATAPLARIDQGETFLFGHPWWDYWFPLAYVGAGGRLRKVDAPVLFHLQHQQRWNQEHFIANGRKTISWLRRSRSNLPGNIVAELPEFSDPDDISQGELERFGTWCFAELRTMAQPIEMPRQEGGAGQLGGLVALLDDPQRRTLIGELDGAEARVLAAARLRRAIDEISPAIGEQRIRSDEDALRVVDRAARILGARKATLLHFWTANVRSFRTSVRAQAAAVIPLRHAMKAMAEAVVALARAALVGLLRLLLSPDRFGRLKCFVDSHRRTPIR